MSWNIHNFVMFKFHFYENNSKIKEFALLESLNFRMLNQAKHKHKLIPHAPSNM